MYAQTQISQPESSTLPLTSMSDEEIVAHVKRGACALFASIVVRHRERLFRIVARIVRDDFEAEDIVQETFVRALIKLSQYNGTGSFAAWLSRVAVHEALGRKRKHKRSRLEYRDADDPVVSHAVDDAQRCASPEAIAMDNQLRTSLNAAVGALPDHFRSVFTLRAVEGLSTIETAERVGIPPQTVKTRLHRAKRLLRERLVAERTERTVGFPALKECSLNSTALGHGRQSGAAMTQVHLGRTIPLTSEWVSSS